MIRVFYDSQIFLAQTTGGISRYFVEIIKEFQSRPELGIEPVLNLSSSNNEFAYESLGIPINKHANSKIFRASTFYDQSRRDRKFRGYDLRHFTFYSKAYGVFTGPTVSTLYDMIPETFPKRGRNPHLAKRTFLEKSSGVLSISQTSLSELERIWRFQPSLAEVTYLGVDESFRPGMQTELDLPEKFFLLVGQRGGYKRGELALEALAHSGLSEHSLVFVGPNPAKRSEKRKIEELGLSGRVKFLNVRTAELPGIYGRSAALIFPSLQEGFGFPPVEAVRSGARVIAVDNEINHEISGDSLLYFSPDDVAGLTSLMVDVATVDVEKSMLFEELDTYTWSMCAEKTADFYRKVLSSS